MPRVVLVTGCSTGGIGYALCEEFAKQGCKVYATSRRTETIADFGDKTIEKLALDVTSDEGVQKVVDHIVEKEGQIDVVVNNAGVDAPGPLVDHSLETVKHLFDTNLFAVLRISKAVVPIMAKRKTGTIVNIGSVVGEISTPWTGPYCASKAALKSISEVLSMELKPFNISVFHVAPGAIRTNMAPNSSNTYKMVEGSLYAEYLPNILVRINESEAPEATTAQALAEEVVRGALATKPPRYAMLGGKSWLFKLLVWLPTTVVLNEMWTRYSKKA